MQGSCKTRRILRPRTLLAGPLSAIMLALSVSSAAAASSIEGVWSFNGGQIAVQSLPSGTFIGTVVAETKFAECTHPVGQQIWTSMTPEPDGSYQGFHQWYFESASCQINPTLGPTAWRVLPAPGGGHFLRACFSSPGGSQPEIAPDGSSTGVSYGCVDSARVASLPTLQVLGLKGLVSAPSTKKCFSRRAFEIHVRDPKHDPFKTITITIAGRKLAVKHQGEFSVALVKLKGEPRGSFTLKIHGTTVLGQIVSGHRTYHTCAKKRSPKKKHHA
jgi:hypothetical protein